MELWQIMRDNVPLATVSHYHRAGDASNDYRGIIVSQPAPIVGVFVSTSNL